MRTKIVYLSFIAIVAAIICTCSGDKPAPKSAAGGKPAPTLSTLPDSTTKAQTQTPLPQSDRYYVLDGRSKTIFEIDLNNNKISKRFIAEDVVAIAYDMGRDWVYEGVGGRQPAMKIFDPKQDKYLQTFAFPEPPSDLLFQPIKKHLYVISEDSTYFRVFVPDSMKFQFQFPLWITDKGKIGPRVVSPGPAGKIVMANGARGSVTEMLTDNNYIYQTVIIHEAKFIDNAVFSYDGNSTFCCDSKQGKIFRVEFGSGDILKKKEGLDNPRYLQFEVNSRTLVAVVGKTDVLMLNQDSLAETGRVNLEQYGDNILSLVIPPKANYAEITMDYKGVTRWLRFDLKTWQPTRLVELI